MVDESAFERGTDLMQPLTVAVIVPARNEEARLGRCLESVRAALLEVDVGVAEIIVVDDDSNDQTAVVAASFGARVMSQRPRGGPLAAWNRAAQSTSADVLVLVDGDCAVKTGALPVMLRHFAKDNVGVVAAQALPFNRGRRMGLVERSAWFSAFVLDEVKRRLVDHDFLPIGRLMAVRSVAWRVERTDCAPCDRAVAHWVKVAGWSIEYEPEAVVHYDVLLTMRELRADFRRTATKCLLEFDSDPLTPLVQARAFLIASAKAPRCSTAWILCRLRLFVWRLIFHDLLEPSKRVYWDVTPGKPERE